MSRIHGFHELTMEVVEREAAKGDLKLSLGERAISVDQAGSIITDKGNETTPGARAYWCTGYRANNGFMKDPRTAASVASCLDDEGFINAGPTHQLSIQRSQTSSPVGTYAVGIGLAAASGWRLIRTGTPFLICENIERLAGTLERPAAGGAHRHSKKGRGRRGRNRQRIRVHLAGQDGHALIREVAGDENVLSQSRGDGREIRADRRGT